MPRLAPDDLLQRALWAAAEDRRSLSQAYGNEGPDAQAAITEAKAILALKNRRIRDLDADALRQAFLAFLYAEQYEQSLADAQADQVLIRRSLRAARRYRVTRRALWGRTVLEAAMERAVMVDSMEYLHAMAAGKRN